MLTVTVSSPFPVKPENPQQVFCHLSLRFIRHRPGKEIRTDLLFTVSDLLQQRDHLLDASAEDLIQFLNRHPLYIIIQKSVIVIFLMFIAKQDLLLILADNLFK